MKHDPAADFRKSLVKVLTLEQQMSDREATYIATQVANKYLSCIDEGSLHFELLNVTLRWRALCEGVMAEKIALLSGRFTVLLLVGVMRWFDDMRYFHQFGAPYAPHREDLAIDYVEAVTCMAIWKQGTEADTYWPADPLEVLQPSVNDIIQPTAFDAIDKQRLQEAIERLEMVHCLSPHAGWYGLREEMRYQVPEE